MRAVALLALIALAALGCAGKSKSAAPASAQEPAAAPLQRQPDIEALDAEIRRWRVELGLTETPRPMAAGATDVDGACGELTECKDPCDLADKICENKEKICEIAADLADPWATQKCDDATRSCEDARAICSCCEKRSAPP